MKITLFLKKYRFFLIGVCLLSGMTILVTLNQGRWGLRGNYYANMEWQGEPAVSRLDKRPWLENGTGARRVGSEQFSVIWQGWIAISRPGSYRFWMRSDDGSSLAVNGQLVVDIINGPGIHQDSGEIRLEPGAYQIEVRYLQAGGYSALRPYWAPPGDVKELLPSCVLFARYPGRHALTWRLFVVTLSKILTVLWFIALGAVILLILQHHTRRIVVIVMWTLFTLFAALIAVPFLKFDFRQTRLVGDQASHLMQALSLAYDGDLRYDEGDLMRWRELGWSNIPTGLFYQRYSKGYAFAKPYGYSLILAPCIRLLGPVKGVVFGNLFIFSLLVYISVLLLRMRYTGATVPFLTGVFYFASFPYMYLYVIHAELFLATLVAAFFYALLSYAAHEKPLFLYASGAIFAWALSEKIVLLLLFFPALFVVIVRKKKHRHILILTVVSLVTLIVSLLPYFIYSDFHSWNPYAAERYYAGRSAHFAPDYPGDESVHIANREQVFSTQFIFGMLGKHIRDVRPLLRSCWYYAFGAHTGMFVFLPLAFFILVCSLNPRSFSSCSLAILAGILAYIAFYVILFPENYYGGAQSLGNRYFLQIATAIFGLMTTAKLSQRTIHVAGILGLLALAFLWPHHQAPMQAYSTLYATSEPQRYMPLEHNQQSVGSFVDKRRTMVNIGLLPQRPKWMSVPENLAKAVLKEAEYIFLNGTFTPRAITRIYRTYQYQGNVEIFTPAFELRENTVYMGNGLSLSASGELWSGPESSIVMEAVAGESLCILANAHGDPGRVRVQTGNVRQDYSLPLAVCLQSSKPVKISQHIRFTTDQEEEQDEDHVSFSIRLAAENDMADIPFEKQLMLP